MENLIITTADGKHTDYSYSYFKEGFEEYAERLKGDINDVGLLRQYITECGYKIVKITTAEERTKEEIEHRIDGETFELHGREVITKYEGGVLEITVEDEKIFEERIDEPFFTKNLIQEISHILHHHANSRNSDELHEIDTLIYEKLKDLE